MPFGIGCKAKVWDIDDKEWCMSLRVSTESFSSKSKKHVQDFSGFVRCLNDAYEKAKNLKVGDKILVKEFNVTSKYDATRHKDYTNFNIFDFDICTDEKNEKGETVEYLNLGKVDLEFDPNADAELPFC